MTLRQFKQPLPPRVGHSRRFLQATPRQDGPGERAEEDIERLLLVALKSWERLDSIEAEFGEELRQGEPLQALLGFNTEDRIMEKVHPVPVQNGCIGKRLYPQA